MSASNYSVTISIMGPNSSTTCRLPNSGTCESPAFYLVGYRREDVGETGGTPVCPEHLFSSIAFFLGLPARVP